MPLYYVLAKNIGPPDSASHDEYQLVLPDPVDAANPTDAVTDALNARGLEGDRAVAVVLSDQFRRANVTCRTVYDIEVLPNP